MRGIAIAEKQGFRHDRAMNDLSRLNIELPQDLADSVRARVASGAYADESAVIREGLELLEDRERVGDDELRIELVAGYDAWKADPSQVYSVEEVRERLRDRRWRRG
jgi:putative addiction module CopG family antidote